jgi:hypothetical protein
MKISERCGLVAGYPLGIFAGTISFIRASRMFHPVGTVVDVHVKNIHPYSIFKENAFMRFSSAWWKHKEWRDVLGVAIRFSGEQDLLFASFKHPWQTPAGPFLTKYHNFFHNRYYAVSPFKFQNKKVIFRLSPSTFVEGGKNRMESLDINIKEKATFKLEMKEQKGPWQPIAEIKLLSKLEMNQKELKFNPFLNGLEIYPQGFIHYLRIGVYRLSQLSRSLR